MERKSYDELIPIELNKLHLHTDLHIEQKEVADIVSKIDYVKFYPIEAKIDAAIFYLSRKKHNPICFSEISKIFGDRKRRYIRRIYYRVLRREFGHPDVSIRDYVRTFLGKLKSPPCVINNGLSIVEYLEDEPITYCPAVTASAIVYLAYKITGIYITKAKISNTLPVSLVALTTSSNYLEKKYGISRQKIYGNIGK